MSKTAERYAVRLLLPSMQRRIVREDEHIMAKITRRKEDYPWRMVLPPDLF